LHIFKGFRFSEIESDNCSNCPPVIGIGNGPEPLLSGCVPNLVLDDFALDVGCFGGELNSDGGFGVHVEGVVYKSGEQVGLPNP